MNWIYLFVAACFETCWTFSLKFLSFGNLKLLRLDNFYSVEFGLPILLPFLGYIMFGIGNIYFFSMAMKSIPAATAFAVWTSISIVLIKGSELLFMKGRISWMEIVCIGMITVGIMGLKKFGS